MAETQGCSLKLHVAFLACPADILFKLMRDPNCRESLADHATQPESQEKFPQARWFVASCGLVGLQGQTLESRAHF